jgi:hypothetical protein
MEGVSCNSAHHWLIVFELEEQTCPYNYSHISFTSSNSISTNVAVPFNLLKKQFVAMIFNEVISFIPVKEY